MRTVADVLRECAERYASAADVESGGTSEMFAMYEKEIYDITRNPSGFGMKLTDEEIADAIRQLEAWNTRAESVFVTGTTVAIDGEPVTYAPTRTCHNVVEGNETLYYFVCSECGWNLVNVKKGSIELAAAMINSCPHCGAKVVSA